MIGIQLYNTKSIGFYEVNKYLCKLSGSFSLLPAATIRRFGTLHSTANYGLVFTAAVSNQTLEYFILFVST